MVALRLRFGAVLMAFLAGALGGCGPGLQEARQLGFASVEEMETAKSEGYSDKAEYDARYPQLGFSSLTEMRSLQARNFLTKQDYLDVKAFTPDVFVRKCFEVNRISYAYICRGRRLSWTVRLVAVNGSSARFTPLEERGESLSLEIDSKAFFDHVNPSLRTERHLGITFEIDGVVGARNFKRPNIDNITHAILVAAPFKTDNAG